MDFQSIFVIIAWGLIVIFGLGGLLLIGLAGDQENDVAASARLWRLFIGFILLISAVVIWRNLSSADLVVRWVLCIVLGILGPILTWVGIENLSSSIRKPVKQYLVAGGGIVSTGLAILVAVLWLGINNIIGWLLFIILGILSLVLIGWGIYDFTDFEPKKATLKITGGCISAILTLVISYFWLHSTTTLHLVGWVFFVIFGILGIVAIIWGLLMFLFSDDADDKKSGIFFVLGGTAGIGLAWMTGAFFLRMAWLSKVNFWNPFVILPIVTILIGVILGFLVNLFEDAVYKGGSSIDRSAEWRIVGRNSKYSDATVRDVYDHTHGRGSWDKSTKGSILFWRIVCVLLSAFGFIGSLQFTSMKDASPVFKVIFNEFNTYSWLLLVVLGVILLLVSGLIEVVFGTKSKHN